MKSRILVAVVGVPVLAWAALWAPLAVVAVLLAALAGIAGTELQRCVGGGKSDTLTWICAVFPALSVLCSWAFPERAGLLFLAEGILLFAYAVAMAGEVKFDRLTAALFSCIAVAWSFASLLRIASLGIHRAYLLLPFILSFACDTFAFFAGLSFGRHKLAPKVSPKKTVEGSVGGLLGNVVCGLAFAFVMDRFFGAGIGYGAMAVLALACGVVAQLGDLSFSLIKREFGVKDYGKLFLEHGGVLDRFDSVLFVAPVVEMILRLVK